MSKVLTRNGYIINKKSITKTKLNKIKKDLTVKPIVHKDYADEVESYPIYKENKTSICVPRYYGQKLFGKPDKVIPMDKHKIDIKFNGELREIQKPIVKKSLEVFKKTGGGILAIPCGFGKTILAIYLACQLKLKTLVVVHKTFLQNQWYDRIKTFSNARIGMIRQKKVDIKNKDIVIGMLQSISMIDYDSSIFDEFGFLIFDETHHAAAKVFSKALTKTGGAYTLGLSATPFRADGLTKVLYWYLGDIMYRVKRKGDNKVIVKMLNYESNDKLFTPKKMWRNGKTIPALQKMITNVSKINSRNKLICDILTCLRKQYERKVLVLSGRLEHLKKLKELVDEEIEKDVKQDLLDPDEIRTGYYIGGMKEYQLKDSSETDIIFATFAMADEGLDIDKLNTLILSTQKGNVEQSVGRIMRKPIKEGDIQPLIIDFNDQLSSFIRWGDKRRKYYEKNKYTIDFYQCWNNKIISIKDYLIINKIVTKKDAKKINDEEVRKQYICDKEGESQYEFEKDMEFEDEPINKYNYDPDINKIFKIQIDLKDLNEDKTLLTDKI